jgi:hypothetical protein
MKMKIKFLSVFALVLVMLPGLSGCSTPDPAGLTDEQPTVVAENILQSIDANDYQKFVQDFSDQMKAAFTEDKFNQLRKLLNASGKYVSLDAPSLSNNQGYAVYRFPCKYENENVYVTITFLIGGQKVEGLLFDSNNLRKASQ